MKKRPFAQPSSMSLACALALSACSDPSGTIEDLDASVDAAIVSSEDAALDASDDAAPPPADATIADATDASADAASDAGVDAANDASEPRCTSIEVSMDMHVHTLAIPADDLYEQSSGFYLLGSTPAAPHVHNLQPGPFRFAFLRSGQTVTMTSSSTAATNPFGTHAHTVTLRCRFD